MKIQRNTVARAKIFFLAILLICLTCCNSASPGSSPAAAIEKWHRAMNGGDVKGVVRAYSADWIKRMGGDDKARKNSELVVALAQDNIKRSGRAPELRNVKETINGDKAVVSFEQGAPGATGGSSAVMHLVRESGEWKIDAGDVSVR